MIVIIGAGLSGLVAGYQLKKANISFIILEARNRVGGRIYTKNSEKNTPVEMGATWFWEQHTNLKSLLEELRISHFEQYMTGTSFFQPFSTAPASAMPIPSQEPSYRISGGTSTIIHALEEYIGKDHICLNEEVKHIELSEDAITVKTVTSYHASHVILALPPKLWAKRIRFSPSLPNELEGIANETHTWMEESIKVAITYSKPFWRIHEQSGTLFSNSGPITELYDHCNAKENTYALCGFVSSGFQELSIAKRKDLIIQQLINVFGDEAKDFVDYNECVWSQEDKTFVENSTALYPHQNNGHPIYRQAYFNDRLLISGSEASPVFPGYMEGAIISANSVVERVEKAYHQ